MGRARTARRKTSSRTRPATRPTARAAGRRAARGGSGWPSWLGVAAVGAAALVAFFLARGEGESTPTRPSVGGDLHSLVVDPENPARLVVGAHHGVASSTDGGKTWRQVDTLEGADAMGWAFPGDRVLVGGHPGLSVSEDAGRTFEGRNEGLPATDIHALGAAGQLVYAASPQLGVFASPDGGRTWEGRTGDVGRAFMGRIPVDPSDPDHVEGTSLVEMSPRDPRRLYAAVHEGDAAVVWVSRDGGGTWSRS